MRRAEVGMKADLRRIEAILVDGGWWMGDGGWGAEEIDEIG